MIFILLLMDVNNTSGLVPNAKYKFFQLELVQGQKYQSSGEKHTDDTSPGLR